MLRHVLEVRSVPKAKMVSLERVCLLDAQERTSLSEGDTSEKCHFRTHALWQSTPLDHLVCMRGKCCALTISRRPCRRSSSTPPSKSLRASNALIARHEAGSTRSRATSSTKPPPTAATPAQQQRVARQRRLCRGAIAAVLRRGPYFREHGSVCRAPRNGTHAAVELPMVLPIRILQLSHAAQQLIDNNGTIERICK